MFFNGVASMESSECYRESAESYSCDDVINDLLNQIYAAADICSKKFSNQKKGLIFSTIGLFTMFFWLFIGYITF